MAENEPEANDPYLDPELVKRRQQYRDSKRRRRGGVPLLRSPAQCGSISGAHRHRNNGEKVCADCLIAENEVRRSYYVPTGRPPGRPLKTREEYPS